MRDIVPSPNSSVRGAQLNRQAAFMASVRQRLAEVPDSVHTVIVGLTLAGLYFAIAAVLELSGLRPRLPLAPKPWLGLCGSLTNVGLAIGLFKAVGWVRPLVALVPLIAYPLEYGLRAPNLPSMQAAELVSVCVVMPLVVVYLLYRGANVRHWFSTAESE